MEHNTHAQPRIHTTHTLARTHNRHTHTPTHTHTYTYTYTHTHTHTHTHRNIQLHRPIVMCIIWIRFSIRDISGKKQSSENHGSSCHANIYILFIRISIDKR